MFKVNKLYRHRNSLGDVDFLCEKVSYTNDEVILVTMRPVHRRLGIYERKHSTVSVLQLKDMDNWIEVTWTY